jgi:hypothetical protein
VEDLGPPIAFLALEEGTPVLDPDGKHVGVVDHVFAEGDIFEGLLIHSRPLAGRHLYADAEQVAEIHERGVLLAVSRDQLHAPADPSKRKRDEDTEESPLEARLRRAWDWLTRAH